MYFLKICFYVCLCECHPKCLLVTHALGTELLLSSERALRTCHHWPSLWPHTTPLDHIHPLPLSWPIPEPYPTPLAPPISVSFWFASFTTHQIQCVLPMYSRVCGAIHWSTVDLPGTTTLKKLDPSPRSHALWLTPQIKLRACEPLPSALWSIDWLDLIQVLCRRQQLLWAHRCTGLLMPGRGCFAPVLASLTFGSHSASPSSSVMVL